MSKDLPIPPRFEKQNNPEFVELLKEAKTRLSHGYLYKEIHICLAIPGKGSFRALRYKIGSALGDNCSYGGWLAERYERSDLVPLREIQAARHRWVDQMIEDFGGTP